MKKYLASLMLVTAMTCTKVYGDWTVIVYRCENNEVICYTNITDGGFDCKFKEQSDE